MNHDYETKATSSKLTTESDAETRNKMYFTCKIDEIKFFLREYQLFEAGNNEFFYILPFDWIKTWDEFITTNINALNNMNNMNTINSPPEMIDSSKLIDDYGVIKPDLIENVDFVILPKSVALLFKDMYKSNRRLKTKNRHVYTGCNICKLCKFISIFIFILLFIQYSILNINY